MRPGSKIAGSILIATLILLGVEIAVRSFAFTERVASRPIGLSDPAVFAAKLIAFAKLPSPKFAVLGDSVALGSLMGEFGVRDWQSKDLASVLSRDLKNVVGGNFYNFGSNGARPSDLKHLARLVRAAGSGTIVVTLGLRSFSQDFETDADEFEMPWLESLKRCRRSWSDLKSCATFEAAMHWQTLAAFRFWLQDGLNGDVSRFVDLATASLGRIEKFPDPLEVALRARPRYESIGFYAAGKQIRSLGEVFDQDTTAKFIVAYENENPDLLENLMAEERLVASRTALATLLGTHANVIYLGPDDEAPSEEFLDHVHPTPAGYERLARRLAPLLSAGR